MTIKKETHNTLNEIKKNLLSKAKNGTISISVSIYTSTYEDSYVHDVEINVSKDNEFLCTIVSDAYYTKTDTCKNAERRAEVVLKYIKELLQYHENIKVHNSVELYS